MATLTPAELAAKLAASEFPAERLMSRIALVVLANAQKRTPVKTGLLRRSLTFRVEAEGQRGFVGTNVKYAPFVHDGTKYMASRPFLAEGLQDSQARIRSLLEEFGGQYLASMGDI